MPAPFNNLRSKNDRAICAYLIKAGCGSVDDTLPNASTAKRAYPNTTVHSTISKVEENFTGNRRIRVNISIKGKASQSVQDPDSKQSRINFDQRIAQTDDALMQTDNEQDLSFTAAAITAAGRALAVDLSNGADPAQKQLAADNADMADYTCLNWYEAGEGDGPADAEGCSWEEIIMFDAVCCASAIN
jgi:hypothetical protein